MFDDGRNQVCPSEAVNAYYSAALLGLAYGDVHVVAVASMIMSLEIHASKMWWQVSIFKPNTSNKPEQLYFRN